MKEELKLAVDTARMAGEAVMQEYTKPHEIDYKADESPVTQADRLANELIVTRLRTHYPDYGILAEESADDLGRLSKDWCWIVDPIDGTREYIKRNGEFTVNIALAYRHSVRLGVIYVPVTGELYYAVDGQGAFYEHQGVTTRIHVSDRTEDLVVLVGRTSQPEASKQLIAANTHRISRVVSTGSSLKGCLIARGEADVYYRFGPTMEWDLAAMEVIVREAGGTILEMDGRPFRYNRRDSLNAKGFYVVNDIRNRML